jgi:hypothetical protein
VNVAEHVPELVEDVLAYFEEGAGCRSTRPSSECGELRLHAVLLRL